MMAPKWRRGELSTGMQPPCLGSQLQGPAQSMLGEPLFEVNDIRITPYIAFIKGSSYQISTIESVHVAQQKTWNPVAVVAFFFRLGSTCYCTNGSPHDRLGRGLLHYSSNRSFGDGGGPLFQLILPSRLYALVLRTASGDLDALTSRKQQFVSDLKKAFEQAFSVRAGEVAPPAESGSE